MIFKYIFFYQLKNNDTLQLNAEITAQETLNYVQSI